MAKIVLADDGIEFDGRTPEHSPLGGAESSVIALCETLARRGHEVIVRNVCKAPVRHNGVDWAPLEGGLPPTADLFIANRGDRLIQAMPGARRTVFWIHNPATYLLKGRYLWKLWRKKPAIVFIGDYHATTYPAWAPGGERVVIPYGLPDMFRTAAPAPDMPGPRAIFTSNPLRGLDWLLEVWAEKIHPRVPGAELHVFSGPATYGAAGREKAQRMGAVLDRARALAAQGVVLRAPVAKAVLLDELRWARVMLYKGDVNETFCMALGEAQAVGVPAVVQPIGSVVERVVDGRTGFIAVDASAFADGAVRLLSDEACWRRMHAAALELQRNWTWDEAAAAFERLIPEEKGR
ncbi:MAG: glycosyltransferase family 4 protein [Alphaproteobacteria bacterium]